MALKIREPIIVYNNQWTKERIFEQLDRDGGEIEDFTANDIPDALAVKWVVRHDDEAWEAALAGGERAYVDTVGEINEWLINQIRGDQM